MTAIEPRDESGSQFLCYGDSCSGVLGSPNSVNLAKVNATAARLAPAPEFVAFLGDEIIGLTRDVAALRQQWRTWLDQEMAWLDRSRIPLYHVASNHTTYDEASERIFREVLCHLPRNGPSGQEGLTYYVRHHNLLLIFVNTSNSTAGGDGWIETEWLEAILTRHADVPYKLVFGHQPVHAVNGYSGPCMRELAPEAGRRLWSALIRHRVTAYICSHMLAFDVQVHDGVLQILTSGAGTAHLLPGEYLHFVQMAVDAAGLRYQVIDTTGTVRERLDWPLELPEARAWADLPTEDSAGAATPAPQLAKAPCVVAFKLGGRTAKEPIGAAQTLVVGSDDGLGLSPVWIGLRGPHQQLCVILSTLVGRSPQIWRGPEFGYGETFSVQVALHTGMGPGGVLWRGGEGQPWSSMLASAQWGPERIGWPSRWSIGHDSGERKFRGSGLVARCHVQSLSTSAR